MSSFRERYKACQQDIVRASLAYKAGIASGLITEANQEAFFERELAIVMNERAARGEFDDARQEVIQ